MTEITKEILQGLGCTYSTAEEMFMHESGIFGVHLGNKNQSSWLTWGDFGCVMDVDSISHLIDVLHFLGLLEPKTITPSQYQHAVLQTANKVTDSFALTNWALGLTGEAGEVADIVKKHVFHGKPLDKKHLLREVGDVLWYAAMLCNWLEVDMGEVMRANVEKLQARYPNGFEKVGE